MTALIRCFSLNRFCASVLQAFGVLWLLVKVTVFFFSDRPWVGTIKDGWWVFLACGILVGLYRACPRLILKSRISETDIDVEVRVGNLFSSNGAIIVSSNSTFDTALEDKTISASSVQGQFTNHFCTSIIDLDHKIDTALKGMTPVCIRNRSEKPYGKAEEYELGTVLPIEAAGKRAYFVAVARLNEHRVASVDRDGFLDSLPRMWSSIRNRGGFEPLCCPILGSGHSRLNLNREELLQEIIKSFVAASIEAKFCEKLTVFVHPKDFVRGRVNLQKIDRFLEHQCVYARSYAKPINLGPIGTPIT